MNLRYKIPLKLRNIGERVGKPLGISSIRKISLGGDGYAILQ